MLNANRLRAQGRLLDPASVPVRQVDDSGVPFPEGTPLINRIDWPKFKRMIHGKKAKSRRHDLGID